MKSPDIPRRRRALAPLVGAAALALLLPAGTRAQGAQLARTDTLTLSLADAVARARRASDEVQLAQAQVEATDAQFTIARASALPQLRINSAYTKVLENARAQVAGQAFNHPNTYTANANLSWQIFQGGRAVSAWRSASRLRQAAKLDAVEVRELVSLDVARAYLQAIVNERVAAIQVRNVALSTERVTQAEQQQAAGRAARYDVLRVRVERANLEPLALQAANDAELARLELKRLLNIPAEQPVRLTTDVAPADIDVLARQVAVQDSLSTPDRPIIRSAALERDARRLGIRVARADLLPTVSVFAQFGYLALPGNGAFPTRIGDASIAACNDTTATRPCQNNGWFADRQVGVQVSWALFDGFRAKGNIDLAQAQARIAELQLRLAREQVATEVARARAELTRARASWEAPRQNATEADEAFRLASLRQNRGLGTQLEVSDAQLALLTAQTNAARATYDVYLASAGLAFALGRPLPLPPSSTPAPARSSSLDARPAVPASPAPSGLLRADDSRHE
jgi:outer membrane protein TolC